MNWSSVLEYLTNVRFIEVLTLVAIVLAPAAGVYVNRRVEERRDVRKKQTDVLKTLMATRALPLSPVHVEALNRIEMEFYGIRDVTAAWRAYLDHMGAPQGDAGSAQAIAWGDKRLDLLAALLCTMAQRLGYDFDAVHIKRAAYYPIGYQDIEADILAIRKSGLKLLTGEAPLRVRVEESHENE
jgi:hypothetical protein